MSRRSLLLGAGAAVGALTVRPGAAAAHDDPSDDSAAARDPYLTTFGRMFPELPPFAVPSAALTAALLDVARPGGVLDAKDDLTATPAQLIVDPSLSLVNRDNPTTPAGTTFLGQFLDHELTFDVSSLLGVPADPSRSTNGRSPRFDLDAVYGAGPAGSHTLYEPSEPLKLRVESGGMFEDLPRHADGTAIIADPRNDENLVLSGLHCAFLLAHNRAVDELRASGVTEHVFSRARRQLTRHYQWIIVHEFLPQIVGPQLVAEIMRRGTRYFRPQQGAFIPVEFQGAAYRMGHSMVRPSYRANLGGNPGGQPFFGMLFAPGEESSPDPEDLSGGVRAPRRFIGWQTFFDFGDGLVRPNKRTDTHLSTPLFHLPPGAIVGGEALAVLPQRTLLRHVTWSLPSGQAVAQAMGVPSLQAADFAELAGYDLGLDGSTPLWYYVLKEAELLQDGLRLGPVGGRIVAEVFLGLLRRDPTSYLNTRRAWHPTWPSRYGRREFRMVDLLTYAGVDPVSRGQ